MLNFFQLQPVVSIYLLATGVVGSLVGLSPPPPTGLKLPGKRASEEARQKKKQRRARKRFFEKQRLLVELDEYLEQRGEKLPDNQLQPDAPTDLPPPVEALAAEFDEDVVGIDGIEFTEEKLNPTEKNSKPKNTAR